MTFLYRETIEKDLKEVTEKVRNASAKLREERIMLMKVDSRYLYFHTRNLGQPDLFRRRLQKKMTILLSISRWNLIKHE